MHTNDLPSHLDGQAILQRLHSDEIPSSWRVIRASRKKLIILLSSFCTFVCLLISFLTMYLFANSASFFLVPRKTLYEEVFYGILMVMLLFLLLTCFVSFMTWVTMRSVVFVLVPEGFVRGDSIRRKKVVSIHYHNVKEMHIDGSIVILALRGAKWRKKWIDCRLLEVPTKEVATTLLQAYEDFQTQHAR